MEYYYHYILFLLFYLARNGGDDFLLKISKTAGMVDAMQGNLKQYVKELCPPS